MAGFRHDLGTVNGPRTYKTALKQLMPAHYREHGYPDSEESTDD